MNLVDDLIAIEKSFWISQ